MIVLRIYTSKNEIFEFCGLRNICDIRNWLRFILEENLFSLRKIRLKNY